MHIALQPLVIYVFHPAAMAASLRRVMPAGIRHSHRLKTASDFSSRHFHLPRISNLRLWLRKRRRFPSTFVWESQVLSEPPTGYLRKLERRNLRRSDTPKQHQFDPRHRPNLIATHGQKDDILDLPCKLMWACLCQEAWERGMRCKETDLKLFSGILRVKTPSGRA